MPQGWVCVHRQILDNPIFKNDKLFRVFMYCLLKASHSNNDQLVGDAVVRVKKGELVSGRKAISRDTNLTEMNVRTALEKLKKLKILTIKSTKKYSIISIVNWSCYQQANQQPTNSQPTANQQPTTNNNVNNVNNVNNIKEFEIPEKCIIGYLDCTNGSYPVTEKDFYIWSTAYPAVDIGSELNKIQSWLHSNEKKRKTIKGCKRFINSWLEKTQNNGGSNELQKTKPWCNGGIKDPMDGVNAAIKRRELQRNNQRNEQN